MEQLLAILLNYGRVVGIIGYFLFGLSIFIGTTSRITDKFFGLEKIIRFHKFFTFFSFVMFISHPIMVTFSHVASGISFVDYLFSYIPLYQFVFGIIAYYFFGIIAVISFFFFKKINFSLWLLLHRLTIVAYFLSTIHLLFFGALSGVHPQVPVLNIFIFLGMFLSITGIIMRVILFFIKPKYKTKVVDIIKETETTYSIVVERPPKFKFKSGQFCFIRFTKKGMKRPHPFTLSSSENETNLMFTIKSAGFFSQNIKGLKSGDAIIIDGPYGVFTNKQKEAVFIAGGVGITPFKSILGDIKQNNPKITLLYGNKNKNDIIFDHWLSKIKSGNVKIINVLSDERVDGYEYGFIGKEILDKYVTYKEDFYICGPPVMVKKVSVLLNSLGVPKRRIFMEKLFWS